MGGQVSCDIDTWNKLRRSETFILLCQCTTLESLQCAISVPVMDILYDMKILKVGNKTFKPLPIITIKKPVLASAFIRRQSASKGDS